MNDRLKPVSDKQPDWHRSKSSSRLLLYAIFAGPFVAALVLLPVLVAWGFYESTHGEMHNRPFAFLPLVLLAVFFLPIGFSPALFSLIFTKRTFIFDRVLSAASVLKASIKGSIMGSLLVGFLLLMFRILAGGSLFNYNGILALMIAIVILGPISAMILWRFRPRDWLGPLNADEIEEWHDAQSGENA